MSMTSRERIQTALAFEEPDRVPIDIGGSNCTGICVDEYVELTRALGLELDAPKVYEPFEMLARMEEPLRQRLHGDVVSLENPSMKFGLINDNWKSWRTQQGNDVYMPGNFNPEVDEQGSTYILDSKGNRQAVLVPGALYFEKTCPTGLSDNFSKMDPDEWRGKIELFSDEHLRIIENNARTLYENTDYAILGEFGKGGLGTTSLFAGHTLTDWICLLVTEPEYCSSILQATAERAVENLKLYLDAVGRYIDVVFISAVDFGTQKAPLFNPDIFRDLYVTNYRMMNDYVHANSRAKTFFHSCGSVFDFLEHFIDAGVDIINPLQLTAANMDARRIKQTYGRRIVFWGGGVDTQTVLPFGTQEEVVEQVNERLQIFAPGGGYVFTPVHCVQHGVPPANLLAAVDAAYEIGRYPMRDIRGQVSEGRRRK
ncbi:MAG: hypothetical protein JXM70_01115 [Pirellulales bacterium]|nr:hypothetical protein [Pirellulales bacterium]